MTVDNIAMHRGEKCLFDSLSFTLSAGEILGISGDSGCGKSTLADLLLGLLKPSQGRIHRLQAIPLGKALKLYQDPPSAWRKASLYRHYWKMCVVSIRSNAAKFLVYWNASLCHPTYCHAKPIKFQAENYNVLRFCALY